METVLVVEPTLPQAVPSHCATVFAPVCLYSAASENSPPDFSFLLVPPCTQGPSFPFPRPRHRNAPVPSDSFQQRKKCRTKEGFSKATRPQVKNLLFFSFSHLTGHCAISKFCFTRHNSTTPYIHLCLHTESFTKFPFRLIFTGQEQDTVTPGGL